MVRRNPVVQFSIALIVVIVAFSLLLGMFLRARTERVQIEAHVSLYPEIVEHVGRMHHEALSVFAGRSDGGGVDVVRESERFVKDVRELTGAERVKAWNANSVVIWSDAEAATGQRFAQNEDLQKALEGNLVYEVEEPDAAENVTESELSRALEVYVPIRLDGSVVGALETYNEADALFAHIDHSTQVMWMAVAAAGVILYLLLFTIYYRSHRAERRSRMRLARAHDATIYALAYQAEQRDELTGQHLERTSIYVVSLALQLRKNPNHRQHLSRRYLRDLFRAAPLHDIGKVRISDEILRKPGPLTEEEYRKMQRHTDYGAETLRHVQDRLGFESFLTLAVQLVRHHHERWDGTGYPDGLSGSQIPLSARLMAVSDVYDALRSQRPYKEAFSHERCVEIIASESGYHFDPEVVAAFIATADEFERISGQAEERLEVAFRNTETRLYPVAEAVS